MKRVPLPTRCSLVPSAPPSRSRYLHTYPRPCLVPDASRQGAASHLLTLQPRASPAGSCQRQRLPFRSFQYHAPSSSSSAAPPLLDLHRAWFKNVRQDPIHGASSSEGIALDWSIRDGGQQECWAVIGPASEQGGRARREIVDVILGRVRPSLLPRDTSATTSALQDLSYHPNVHPFLQERSSDVAGKLRSPPSKAIKHVSFATRMGSAGGEASTGEFTNYSARYGAIRDEDRVTLYERLMDLLDVSVGLIAAQKMLPDPLKESGTDTSREAVGLFKWPSEQSRLEARKRALRADQTIRTMAPLLLIDEALLHRPVIALSNGQTRRARILSSLISGAEMVVLEEPYSGIDVTTREKLSQLFASLHAKRQPRLVLVLREQDEMPDLITHVLRLDDAGAITQMGPRNGTPAAAIPNEGSASAAVASGPSRGGYDLVLRNAASGIGRGQETQPAVINMDKVSIVYGDKTVLDSIDLRIFPGDRTILAGDNGSGKTTLLALILGDHPRSFSFGRDQLSLFGLARDEPLNARPLMAKRIGHLSPELFNAFPRRSAASGGLTVGEVVASGFNNVFARRTYTEAQKKRVWGLLSHFADLVKSPDGRSMARRSAGERHTDVAGEETATAPKGKSEASDVRAISSRGFAELSYGSQAVVLFLRALVSHPQLLVLDEPFQGMDARQVERVRRFLDDSTAPSPSPSSTEPDSWAVGESEEEKRADTEARRKMAVVLVSHYESEWPTRFGRLVRLSDGVVVERV